MDPHKLQSAKGAQMNEKPDGPHAGNRAFTRVDLLALLASMALLLFIVLPALGRVTGKTTIAQCAANLEQYDLALQIYGNENQDILPNFPGGNWVWDASVALRSRDHKLRREMDILILSWNVAAIYRAG